MNNSNKNTVFVDERQKAIRKTAGVISGAFLLVCLIISGAYNIYTTGEIGWEFWAIIGYPIVFGISSRILGDVEPPKDMMNRPLPTGNSKADKKARIKHYWAESAIFAVTCAVMDVILIALGKEDITDFEIVKTVFNGLDLVSITVITAIFAFVTSAVIFFVCDYLINEKYSIPKYNKAMEALDDDEDDTEE